ncbi:hypothetical protein Bbelb_428200 [Branchiostoma belcheri]|nr:hypothetical protein Bbelb_428200 [Branchiostoma belcheri]
MPNNAGLQGKHTTSSHGRGSGSEFLLHPYPCRITWHLLLYDPRNINIHELALFGMTPFLTWAAKGRHPPRRRLRRRPVTSPLTRWGGRAGQSHRVNTFPVLGGIRAQPPAHASAPPTPAAACIAKVLFPRRRHGWRRNSEPLPLPWEDDIQMTAGNPEFEHAFYSNDVISNMVGHGVRNIADVTKKSRGKLNWVNPLRKTRVTGRKVKVPFYIRHQMSGLYLTIDSKGNNIKLQTLDHADNQQWTYDTSNAQDNAFKSVSKPGGETVAMDAGSFVAGQKSTDN